MKLLFDTNILLDLCNDKRAPFHKQCVDLLMEAVAQPNNEIMAPVSSLNDVYCVLRKHYGEERAARDDIGGLMELFDIRPLMERHACMSYRSDEPDFEDGLIRAVAEDNDADVIVTRDVEAFHHSSVRSMDAEQCRALLLADSKA